MSHYLSAQMLPMAPSTLRIKAYQTHQGQCSLYSSLAHSTPETLTFLLLLPHSICLCYVKILLVTFLSLSSMTTFCAAFYSMIGSKCNKNILHLLFYCFPHKNKVHKSKIVICFVHNHSPYARHTGNVISDH
jgi:hypothetical protein